MVANKLALSWHVMVPSTVLSAQLYSAALSSENCLMSDLGAGDKVLVWLDCSFSSDTCRNQKIREWVIALIFCSVSQRGAVYTRTTLLCCSLSEESDSVSNATKASVPELRIGAVQLPSAAWGGRPLED